MYDATVLSLSVALPVTSFISSFDLYIQYRNGLLTAFRRIPVYEFHGNTWSSWWLLVTGWVSEGRGTLDEQILQGWLNSKTKSAIYWASKNLKSAKLTKIQLKSVINVGGKASQKETSRRTCHWTGSPSTSISLGWLALQPVTGTKCKNSRGSQQTV